MNILDRHNADEPDTMGQELIAKLEKVNQELSRRNLVFERINRIFIIIVQDKTEEELANECLSVALEITGSRFGFVNLVGDDGLLHDIAISKVGWKECLMYDESGHRRPPGNYLIHGFYGHVIHSEKSFFTNDPMSHPDSIGVPHGLLGVPLSLDGKMVGMLGVANREGGYNHEQQANLEAIALAITQALQRKKSEDDLRKANKNLKLYSKELQIRSEKLQKTTEIMDAISQNSPELIFVKDRQSRIVFASHSFLRFFGKSADEILGKTDIDFYSDPLVSESVMENDRIVRETRQSLVTEESVRLPDGSLRIYLSTKSPWLAKDSTLLGTFGFSVDITERKMAEKALLESEAQRKVTEAI